MKKHKICFSSVCTNDAYSYFIPLFVYSVKRAYPDYAVRVFVIGKLMENIKEALDLIPFDGWDVVENAFSSYPDRKSVSNSLRFLINRTHFDMYNYVFVKDIDFLIFRQHPTHAEYFIKRMKSLPYFGVRGPYTHPRRYVINRIGWKGNFTRIAGGSFVFQVKTWYKATENLLKLYRKHLKNGTPDGIDRHKPGSYREYDEVMLFRIIRRSEIKTPRRKGKNVYGYHVPKVYRDIHLGDFSKMKRGYGRLCKRVSDENIKNFKKLEKDPVWIQISQLMSKNQKIRSVLRRLRRHVRRR